VFAFDAPVTEQQGVYRVVFPDRLILEFRYHAIQLNRLNWREFVEQRSPVSSALMSKMMIAPEDRARVKLECIRMIAGLKLNKAKTHLVLGFIDTYLRLSQEEEQEYDVELDKLAPAEKETVMETGMSWRDRALQEGLQQGLEQGREQGLEQGKAKMAFLVTRLVEKQFGQVEPGIRIRIADLNYDQLEALGEAVVGFDKVAQLTEWLERT